MIWLTWRQFRIQGIVMAAILAVFGLALLITGPHLVTLFRQSTMIVQSRHPVLDPAWTVEQLNLEDLVLAYMSQASETARGRRPVLEVQR